MACRENFSIESEIALNDQINLELAASHTYLSMAAHFNQDGVALSGFYKFFMHSSEEERNHAKKLIEYQNKRGGQVILTDIKFKGPEAEITPLNALETSLEMEKSVHRSLLALHVIASDSQDHQFTDFIEGEFLKEQVESEKLLSDMITKLKLCGDGLGIFIFDKHLNETMT
ncbi:soma ferritin-like [Zophobas morio]|uniref:soma ferritin-like n=1 Tax=Zophobas morio TaxID=2755281 RepID=UPI0030828A3E